MIDCFIGGAKKKRNTTRKPTLIKKRTIRKQSKLSGKKKSSKKRTIRKTSKLSGKKKSKQKSSKKYKKVTPFTANGVYYSTKAQQDKYYSKLKNKFKKSGPKQSVSNYNYGDTIKGQDGYTYKAIGNYNNSGNLINKRWVKLTK